MWHNKVGDDEMKQIRVRVAVFVCWLVLFCNFWRLIDPLGITAVAAITVMIVAVLILITPGLARGPVGIILAFPILLFLALKAAAGAGVLGADTLLTIAEVCAIGITILLARWVSSAVSEFESAIAHITIGRRGQAPEPPLPGPGSIYREIRRARNYERPLTLMAVAVEEQSVQVALDRMVQEAQLALMKQYALAGVSKVLCEELEDCNVIVQSDGHFLIGLPEVTPEQLPSLMERLRQLVSEQVGVSLRIGAASLPQDGLTFEGLQDKAIQDMESTLDRQPSARPQLSYVEHHSV